MRGGHLTRLIAHQWLLPARRCANLLRHSRRAVLHYDLRVVRARAQIRQVVLVVLAGQGEWGGRDLLIRSVNVTITG
jgi:hypothetical protein